MKSQQEFHRLEVEMRKVAGQHKECKTEYDVTVLKRRRLEKSIGEKHDQHSGEEMLLEHYYRDGTATSTFFWAIFSRILQRYNTTYALCDVSYPEHFVPMLIVC